MEATNGKETDDACEIPNRIGKNNIINYGSFQPPPACHCVVCLHGLAQRQRHCCPGAWVARGLRGPRPPPRHPAGGQLSAQREEGRADPPQGRRHPLPELSRTGSPLFPGTLQEHPEMALALRPQLGRPGDTRSARERCSRALDGGLERPRAEGDISVSTQGRAGSSATQDSHRDSLPPVPDAGRKKSRLNSAAGAVAGSRRQGPSAQARGSARRPRSPSVPFVFLRSRCAVTPVLLFVLSRVKEPPPCVETATLVPQPPSAPAIVLFLCCFFGNKSTPHKVGKPLGSHLNLSVCQTGLLFRPLSNCNRHHRNNELQEIKVTENPLVMQMLSAEGCALWTKV